MSSNFIGPFGMSVFTQKVYLSDDDRGRKFNLLQPVWQCTVNVKVIDFADEEHTVSTMYGERCLRTGVVSDGTAVMKLPLWGKNIEKVEKGKSYKIENVLTKYFQGKMQLTTLANTEFVPISDIETEDKYSKEDEKVQVEGKILTVSVTSMKKCLKCHKSVKVEGIKVLIKCENCGNKQRVRDLEANKCARVQIKSSKGDVQNVVAFATALQECCLRNGWDGLGDDELEDMILMKDTVKIVLKKGSEVVEELYFSDD